MSPLVQTMASSPSGFMTTIRGLDDPLASLVASLVSGVIAPFVGGLRSALLASVDLNALASDAQCVVNGLASSLPDPDVLLAFLVNVRARLCAWRSCSPVAPMLTCAPDGR